MRNRRIVILATFIVLLSGLGSSALEGYVVKSGPNVVQDMIYTWADPSTTPYYQDAQSYADVAFMICREDGSTPKDKYVGLQYLMNNESSRINQLISYGNNNLALADNKVTFNGKTCKRTPIGPTTVSPSKLSGTPITKIAAFPSEAYLMVSDSPDGSNPKFVETSSETQGSFSGSTTYNYDSNEIGLSINQINVQSNIGSQSFSPSNSGRGISSKRPLVLGVCKDEAGQNCPTGAEKLTSPNFPQTYIFDQPKSAVDDQKVYTRHSVANGKRFDTLKIGADLRVKSISVSKNPVYYSQTQNITFNIENTGNVPVTNNFVIKAEIIDPQGNKIDSIALGVSSNVPEKGGNITFNYEWKALSESGIYDVKVTVDSRDDINDISEGDNTRFKSFELKPITLPEVYVNGDKKSSSETTFKDPGIPYNLTLVMKNSDNMTLSNSTVKIIEEDGTSAFSPTQRLDNNTITKTINKVSFETDEDGVAKITIIPTGNALLKDNYDHLSIHEKLNYSIKLKGAESDGDKFKFINNGKLQSYYPMEVGNPGEYNGKGTSSLPNLEEYSKMAMNTVYTIFAEFWGAVA